MRKIAYKDARNLFLTAWGDSARFRAAGKWFTHRTSLTRFAKWAARRGWRRGTAVEGVKRSISPPTGVLRQSVRDYSLKLGESFAYVMNIDVDRFGREIDLGKRIISGLAPFCRDVGSWNGVANKLGTGSCGTSVEVRLVVMEVRVWLLRQKL